jgi:hypothetical protein
MDIEMKMATVNEYFESIKTNEEPLEFPTFKADFLPYIEMLNSEYGPYDYWTGYYSSFPRIKKRIQEVFSRLRSEEMKMLLGKLH